MEISIITCQIYVLYGKMDSGKSVPVCWALLPGKGIPVYERFWSIIQEVWYDNLYMKLIIIIQVIISLYYVLYSNYFKYFNLISVCSQHQTYHSPPGHGESFLHCIHPSFWANWHHLLLVPLEEGIEGAAEQEGMSEGMIIYII